MTRTASTRRAFLECIGGVGAAALGTPARVEGALGFAANDTVNVGCIGTGFRCRMLMKSLAQVPGVRIAAVCDIYDPHLDGAKKLADPSAFATKHYREILDRKDIDAVLIGSPDHWHVPMAIDGCEAGKDVYVEKPLTHDPAEGAAIISTQARTRKVVQVGMQQRSVPHYQKVRELIRNGRIGDLCKVHMTWNRGNSVRTRRESPNIDPSQVPWKDFLGNAPDQPFDPYRFRNWRWFWDFGGGVLTDLMVHWVDVAHWVMGVDHPTKATAIGNHFASKDLWQTPDTMQCLLEYPNNVQAHFEATFSNGTSGAMITFYGTDGAIYIDRGRYEITPEEGKKGEPELVILGSDPRKGLDYYDKPDGELLHLTNWVECIRSRQKPNSPVEAGVTSAAAAHLGNRAYRSGQVAQWSSS